MPMGIERSRIYVYPVQQQADATLSQAAPAQNTWYTILDTTTNVRLLGVRFAVADTNETLEVRFTADGQTLSSNALAATAGTMYYVTRVTSTNPLYLSTGDTTSMAFLYEARSLKVEIRKTTAAGNGTITARAAYALW